MRKDSMQHSSYSKCIIQVAVSHTGTNIYVSIRMPNQIKLSVLLSGHVCVCVRARWRAALFILHTFELSHSHRYTQCKSVCLLCNGIYRIKANSSSTNNNNAMARRQINRILNEQIDISVGTLRPHPRHRPEPYISCELPTVHRSILHTMFSLCASNFALLY